MTSAPFKLHRIEGYIENIFMLEYPDGLLLLDSGCYNDIPEIERYCHDKLGRPPQDIKLIAVSHMHPDHCGGAVALREKYAIPIAAHRNADRWYAGAGGALQQLFDCYMARIVARHNHRKWRRMSYQRILRPDFLLDDGDRLPGFDDWQVFYVPGHTLHDLIFFHEPSSLLYIADMICEVHGQNRLPLPILFPDKMAVSYDKAASLNASTLLLAHGEVIDNADSFALFNTMKERLQRPPNQMARRVHRISVYSPEFRQEWYRSRH